MHVVTNTSPLLSLAVIGEADLLAKVFGNSVAAPTMVHLEMEALSRRNPRFSPVDVSASVNFVPVQDRQRVALLALHLDPGEAEAIALALETQADLLLLDERRATRTAHRLGIQTLGLLER